MRVYTLKKIWQVKNIYIITELYQKVSICGYRLVVRTPGFHPGNRSSILRSRAILKILSFYRGVEKWYLARLITLRSYVRFVPPQPKKPQSLVSVAQLVRARDSYPRGRQFNSAHWHHIYTINYLVKTRYFLFLFLFDFSTIFII